MMLLQSRDFGPCGGDAARQSAAPQLLTVSVSLAHLANISMTGVRSMMNGLTITTRDHALTFSAVGEG
jgi:hypothetical protein